MDNDWYLVKKKKEESSASPSETDSLLRTSKTKNSMHAISAYQARNSSVI